jgi:hypothetical protein
LDSAGEERLDKKGLPGIAYEAIVVGERRLDTDRHDPGARMDLAAIYNRVGTEVMFRTDDFYYPFVKLYRQTHRLPEGRFHAAWWFSFLGWQQVAIVAGEQPALDIATPLSVPSEVREKALRQLPIFENNLKTVESHLDEDKRYPDPPHNPQDNPPRDR